MALAEVQTELPSAQSKSEIAPEITVPHSIFHGLAKGREDHSKMPCVSNLHSHKMPGLPSLPPFGLEEATDFVTDKGNVSRSYLESLPANLRWRRESLTAGSPGYLKFIVRSTTFDPLRVTLGVECSELAIIAWESGVLDSHGLECELAIRVEATRTGQFKCDRILLFAENPKTGERTGVYRVPKPFFLTAARGDVAQPPPIFVQTFPISAPASADWCIEELPLTEDKELTAEWRMTWLPAVIDAPPAQTAANPITGNRLCLTVKYGDKTSQWILIAKEEVLFGRQGQDEKGQGCDVVLRCVPENEVNRALSLKISRRQFAVSWDKDGRPQLRCLGSTPMKVDGQTVSKIGEISLGKRGGLNLMDTVLLDYWQQPLTDELEKLGGCVWSKVLREKGQSQSLSTVVFERRDIQGIGYVVLHQELRLDLAGKPSADITPIAGRIRCIESNSKVLNWIFQPAQPMVSSLGKADSGKALIIFPGLKLHTGTTYLTFDLVSESLMKDASVTEMPDANVQKAPAPGEISLREPVLKSSATTAQDEAKIDTGERILERYQAFQIQGAQLILEGFCLSEIFYGFQFLDFPLVGGLRIRNRSNQVLCSVKVVFKQNDYFAEWSSMVPRIRPGEVIELSQPALVIKRRSVQEITAPDPCNLNIETSVGDTISTVGTLTLRVRPFDDVNVCFARDIQPEVFCLYVTSRGCEAVERLIDRAKPILFQLSGSSAFDGYQSVEDEPPRAQKPDEMAIALYAALREERITYENPSAFPPNQAVKIPNEVLRWRRGTCLDLAILHCALLERIGLHPLLAMVERHMFQGYWRNRHSSVPDTEYRACWRVEQQDRSAATTLNEWICNGAISFLNSVTFTSNKSAMLPPHGLFELAKKEAHGWIQGSPAIWLIDIAKARQAGIEPLPLTRGRK